METPSIDICREKLKYARLHCSLFAMDYDGTLADGQNYQSNDASGLISEILEKGKTPAFITARASTALKIFIPPLKEYYEKNPDSVATYIGGGNGTVLSQVSIKGIEKIYNHGLNSEEVGLIINVWEKYAKNNLPIGDLSEKGIATFNKFYTTSWTGLIPKEILDSGRPYNGRIFTEEAKVTFVLPKDVDRHKKIVSDMQKLLGERFSVAAGDFDFCHITKRLKEDSKVVAIKSIMRRLKLNINQVTTFGDMPYGNDQGLLGFPYSFTNYTAIAETKPADQPPFVLPESKKDPIGSVYKAVKFLLS